MSKPHSSSQGSKDLGVEILKIGLWDCVLMNTMEPPLLVGCLVEVGQAKIFIKYDAKEFKIKKNMIYLQTCDSLVPG